MKIEIRKVIRCMYHLKIRLKVPSSLYPGKTYSTNFQKDLNNPPWSCLIVCVICLVFFIPGLESTNILEAVQSNVKISEGVKIGVVVSKLDVEDQSVNQNRIQRQQDQNQGSNIMYKV